VVNHRAMSGGARHSTAGPTNSTLNPTTKPQRKSNRLDA